MTYPAQQVVHVGLAKTGTTTLQRHVFPQISKVAGYNYNPPELVEQLAAFRLFHREENRARIRQLAADHAPVFLSDEALATWLPQHFEIAADEVLSLFGPQTTILITLRDPVDFQASLYAGSFRAGAYLSPSEFFLSDEQYSRVKTPEGHWLDDFFNVDRFDLRRLVEIYKQRFARVVALPLQTQFNLYALSRLFNLNEHQRCVILNQLASAQRLNARPTGWDIKARAFYVRLTGKQMTSPGLGTKLISYAEAGRAPHSPQSPREQSMDRTARRHLGARRWWRAISRFVLPNTPYQLPSDVYQNAELTRRNREFLADLIADDCASGIVGANTHLEI